MNIDALLAAALVAGAFGILWLIARNEETRKNRRAARDRNKEDGSIVIRPFQQAHPITPEDDPKDGREGRKPRGRIDRHN